jgi:trypsin-like peptidase
MPTRTFPHSAALFLTLTLCSLPTSAQVPLPPDGLFKPTFLTANSSWYAGTAFLLRAPNNPTPLLITCHHLFGPAAGLEQQMSADDIVQQVKGAVALSIQNQKTIVVAPRHLKVQGAHPFDQTGCDKDLAIFAVESPAKLSPFELSTDSLRPGDPVYMFARLRGTNQPKLFPATLARLTPTSIQYIFADKSIELGGTSGAPILDSDGKVVAMNLGGGEVQGKLLGIGNPASALRKAITTATTAK